MVTGFREDVRVKRCLAPSMRINLGRVYQTEDRLRQRRGAVVPCHAAPHTKRYAAHN